MLQLLRHLVLLLNLDDFYVEPQVIAVTAGHRKQEELSRCRRIIPTVPDSSSTGFLRFRRFDVFESHQQRTWQPFPVSSIPFLDAALTLKVKKSCPLNESE